MSNTIAYEAADLIAFDQLFHLVGDTSVAKNIYERYSAITTSQEELLRVEKISHTLTQPEMNNADWYIFAEWIWGLEYLPNLKLLYLVVSEQTELDFSYNLLLEEVTLSGQNLTDINVSNNRALTYLFIDNHSNGGLLSTINVSNNPLLTTLGLYSNSFSQLDLSHNSLLKVLNIDANQFTSLDISYNRALTHLTAFGNKLIELDITNNLALELLSLSFNEITSIDLTNNLNLTYVGVSNNPMTSLDISSNPNLLDIGEGYLTHGLINVFFGDPNIDIFTLYISPAQQARLDTLGGVDDLMRWNCLSPNLNIVVVNG